jgi:hypothetical protein
MERPHSCFGARGAHPTFDAVSTVGRAGDEDRGNCRHRRPFRGAGLSDGFQPRPTADDIARNELGDMYELAKMADTVTVVRLMEDLAVEERLDAAIDKCLKRLLLVKGLKSISASSSSAPPNRSTEPSEAA